MDDEKLRNTDAGAAPAGAPEARTGKAEGSRQPAGNRRRPPAGNRPADGRGKSQPQVGPSRDAAGTAEAGAPGAGQGRSAKTVWSSERRRGGRMPVPAGSVADATANRQPADAGKVKAADKPEDGKPTGKPSADKRGKPAPAQQPRSTGRPTRVPRHASRATELPRMDSLLIDDVPVEPDVSQDAYVPSNADIDRILQYELYTPQSRQIPDVIPAGKTVIVGVRFRPGGKTYFFDPGKVRCQVGQAAIVETARGQEFGEVCMGNRMVDESLVVQPLRPLIRLATEEDLRHHSQNCQREADAYRIGIEKILAHKLDMKLVAAQYTFDNSKLLFYFTSDGRVDFRELVKDLAGVFHIRIELRQIGIRDEARMIGGLGPCGRPLCCSTFLTDFGQVSMKMAKEQNLSLNASKISGCCGRLMCCLRYEHETYQEELRRSPAPGSFVVTPDGPGVVTEVLPILGEVKVSLRNQTDSAPRRYKRDAVSLQAPGLRPGEDTRDGGSARDAGRNRPPVSAPEDDLTGNGGDAEPDALAQDASENDRAE